MKISIILSVAVCLVSADSSDKQDVKIKPTQSTINSIQQTIPKQQQQQEIYLQPIKYQPVQQIQPKPQYVPIQIIPKPYYVPQAQPHAMIIIAQPAMVPQSLLYNNPTQQLLNYFHSNPAAKQQLLYGNYQGAIQPQVAAAPSIGNYILAPAPQQYHQIPSNHLNFIQAQPQYITQPQVQQQVHAHPVHVQQPVQQQQQHQQQPAQQLSQIAHLAQLAAQQYVTSPAPLKTAPAIVTGFENFTPEQQAQIKAQLSTHLGSNFHAVSANQANSQQYSAKYNDDEFIPSPQMKDVVTTMSTSGIGGDIMKTQYTKG